MDPSGLSNGFVSLKPVFEPDASAFQYAFSICKGGALFRFA